MFCQAEDAFFFRFFSAFDAFLPAFNPKQKTAPLSGERLFTGNQILLIRFFPDSFADESGQTAAISGFALESIAGTGAVVESNAFQNFSFDMALGLDIIKFVFHWAFLLFFPMLSVSFLTDC